jgi:hypothetical protein
MKYQSQRGVALVITLIMLSVITFLTVAFLAISRRDRASVTTSISQTDSHLMADTALARFQSELTARMMTANSLQSYDLMVTKNFINPNGYDPALGLNTTNVNYDYRVDGNPFVNNDRLFNIANLFYDPRPPVFISTNRDRTLPPDFRFYLDYNRNRRFETNGLQPVVIDEVGNFLKDADGNVIFKDFNGEPEWIGVLQNPEYPHSATNRFVGRYLYLALPISRTLDLNYIHNYAKGNIGLTPNVSRNNGDGFLRNQGYGSYEINLAAFLHDLNTNMYPDIPTPADSYRYLPDTSSGVFANDGSAFLDAVSFLGYRYTGGQGTLFNVNTLFGNPGRTAFQNDFIDDYATRPILVSPFINTTDPDRTPTDLTTQPWPGSKNPRQYFDPQELFNTNKTSQHFVTGLTQVSARTNSYDRYTVSRLLEQIGTGSEPEIRGKININYVNDPTQNTIQTNFVSWTPYQFFTNVAERLIKDNLKAQVISANQTNFFLFNTNNIANRVRPQISVTNIQIYPTNEYTAPLHRLLQVAANIYDATTSNKYPMIYRPRFSGSLASAYITDFVAETNSVFLANAMTNAIQDRTNITNPDGLVWGIPAVVAAKKGFPNFNEFLLQTSVQVSRSLQITKPTTNSPPTATNQMLVLGISNFFALESWNSYIKPYTNRIRFIATNLLTMSLTNENGTVIWPANGTATNFGISAKVPVSLWPSALTGSNSFILPFGTNNQFNFLTNSVFRAAGIPPFVPAGSNVLYEVGVGYPNPRWGISITNRLIYALIDTTVPFGRVIDFVNLDEMTSSIDVTKELMGRRLSQPANAPQEPTELTDVWRTNRLGNSTLVSVPTFGILKQIDLSMGNPLLSDTDWASFGDQADPASKQKSVAEFTKFMGFTPTIPGYQNIAMPTNTSVQTPFNPVRKLDQTISWQVNDPLVHYMVSDLLESTNLVKIQPRVPPNGALSLPNNLQKINERYRPWGRRFGGGNVGPQTQGNADDIEYAYDFRVKDPRIRWSDDWDFPTNKFPSIGWLGRVHRGTPWQTIYLKAGAITNRITSDPIDDWQKWARHVETHPTNDWRLLDAFTVSPNDNAARGLLSVNQTNQAAWSAVLSGVVVLTNWLNDAQAKAGQTIQGDTNSFQALVIPPGNAISNIVSDINAVRATKPNGVFSSLGEILAVPSLSISYNETNGIIESSPYLNVTNYNLVGTNKIIAADSNGKQRNQDQRFYGVTDEAYERIPQQVASLLKLGEPEFVIYCYGQSLKPAPNSIVVSAPIGSGLFQLCTNYQITGEVVTRTVLRVEGTPQNPKTVIENYNIVPTE